jgi:uncharacterized membrane protein YkvA (DUF1232 family)
MKTITPDTLLKEIKSRSKNLTADDLRALIHKRGIIEDYFQPDTPLGRFVADIKILFSIVQDYITGNYKNIPWHTITAIGGTLLYILAPVDMVPDVILGLGLIDDAAVVALCLKLVEKDLLSYDTWKKGQIS